MATSSRKPKHCVYCRRPEREVGKLSVRGNCAECGAEAMVNNLHQLTTKSGPYYETFVVRRAAKSAQRLRELADPAAG